MDNLFNSHKLYSVLYTAKCLGHGVVHATGRGFPDGIKQSIELNPRKAEALKGTTTAARLVNLQDSPDLLAVCVYDNKPVHLLSTKTRKVYHRESGQMKKMKYLRLNVIDDYNNHMNNVDIIDQLHGHYWPDHWMRHKKWWWAVFNWGIGVAQVNAYKIYVAMWDEEHAKGRTDLPQNGPTHSLSSSSSTISSSQNKLWCIETCYSVREKTLALTAALSPHLGMEAYKRKMIESGTSAASRGLTIIWTRVKWQM